jgi:hypothetical protein
MDQRKNGNADFVVFLPHQGTHVVKSMVLTDGERRVCGIEIGKE